MLDESATLTRGCRIRGCLTCRGEGVRLVSGPTLARVFDRSFEADFADGTLTVRGEVDDYGIIALRNALAEHGSAPGTRLVVDLSEVAYLPSVGVGVITRALGAAERAGAAIVLVARQGTVAQRVLMVCALPYRESLEDDPQDDPDTDLLA